MYLPEPSQLHEVSMCDLVSTFHAMATGQEEVISGFVLLGSLAVLESNCDQS